MIIEGQNATNTVNQSTNVTNTTVDYNSECHKLAKLWIDERSEPICTPEPDAFNPCEDLMGYPVLRVAVWFVAAAAVFGNMSVIIVHIGVFNRLSVPRFLQLNLAIGDFFMGVYLSMLALADLTTIGTYFNYAIDWQQGYGCKIAGVASLFASQLSIFTLIIITFERYFTITYTMDLNKRLKLGWAAKIMAVGWLYAFICATLPVIANISSYSITSICLPMRITESSDKIYIITLLVIDTSTFFIIAGCYAKLYHMIRSQKTQVIAKERIIAQRMALLVLTDFACWAPIIFFVVTAVAGKPMISVTNSKILIVFFYPLNSLANPYLYVISTRQYKRDLRYVTQRVCNWTRNLFYWKRENYSNINYSNNTLMNQYQHYQFQIINGDLRADFSGPCNICPSGSRCSPSCRRFRDPSRQLICLAENSNGQLTYRSELRAQGKANRLVAGKNELESTDQAIETNEMARTETDHVDNSEISHLQPGLLGCDPRISFDAISLKYYCKGCCCCSARRKPNKNFINNSKSTISTEVNKRNNMAVNETLESLVPAELEAKSKSKQIIDILGNLSTSGTSSGLPVPYAAYPTLVEPPKVSRPGRCYQQNDMRCLQYHMNHLCCPHQKHSQSRRYRFCTRHNCRSYNLYRNRPRSSDLGNLSLERKLDATTTEISSVSDPLDRNRVGGLLQQQCQRHRHHHDHHQPHHYRDEHHARCRNLQHRQHSRHHYNHVCRSHSSDRPIRQFSCNQCRTTTRLEKRPKEQDSLESRSDEPAQGMSTCDCLEIPEGSITSAEFASQPIIRTKTSLEIPEWSPGGIGNQETDCKAMAPSSLRSKSSSEPRVKKRVSLIESCQSG